MRYSVLYVLRFNARKAGTSTYVEKTNKLTTTISHLIANSIRLNVSTEAYDLNLLSAFANIIVYVFPCIPLQRAYMYHLISKSIFRAARCVHDGGDVAEGAKDGKNIQAMQKFIFERIKVAENVISCKRT